MILVDTSVWIDHFRKPVADMQKGVRHGIAIHPFVIGEIALGSIARRTAVLRDLEDLVTVLPLPHRQVMDMVGDDRLYATGLQYVDVHLLASARATIGCSLWTRDRRLRAAADRFGVAADLD